MFRHRARFSLLLCLVLAILLTANQTRSGSEKGSERPVKETIKGEIVRNETHVEPVPVESSLAKNADDDDDGDDDDDDDAVPRHLPDDGDTKILTTPKSVVAPDADPSVKTILIWTSFDRAKMWWYGFRHEFGHEVFRRHNCTHTNCNLIYDRSKLNEADFLMFYHEDPPEWPKIRYTWQSYIHIIKERPGPWHRWLKDYEPRINITMNYRYDSDIRFFNNGFHKRRNPLRNPYTAKWSLSRKGKSVVGMISHCGADSKRDDYVAELSKHIDVDIYGSCGTMECPRGRDGTKQCMDRFQKQYKFYLSFENAFCKDYVTEKLYRTLSYELVPIVLGAANYSRDAPPHSVIDVRDFDSPKALAGYLKHLSRNEDEYNSYFAWKQWYVLFNDQDCYCTVCDALNEPAVANKKAGGYYDWWFSGCDNDVIDRMKEKGGWL